MDKDIKKYQMIPISFIRLVYSQGISPESLLPMIYDFCMVEQSQTEEEQACKNHQFLTLELKEFEQQYGKDSRASIRRDWLEDAANGKIPFDLFRLIVAIKSIIGKKGFAKTSKSVVITRMLGCKSGNVFIPEMHEDFNFYIRRRQFDKLMNAAINRGFVQKLSSQGKRGFYISTRYKTSDSLQKAITTQQRKWESKKEEMERAAFELKKHKNKSNPNDMINSDTKIKRTRFCTKRVQSVYNYNNTGYNNTFK